MHLSSVFPNSSPACVTWRTAVPSGLHKVHLEDLSKSRGWMCNTNNCRLVSLALFAMLSPTRRVVSHTRPAP